MIGADDDVLQRAAVALVTCLRTPDPLTRVQNANMVCECAVIVGGRISLDDFRREVVKRARPLTSWIDEDGIEMMSETHELDKMLAAILTSLRSTM